MNRFEETKKAGLFGMIGNLFLLIIKASVGFLFKSQAMIADAANSAGDIFASLMTFVGNKIASEPQDNSHNFGHGKAEYIFSMLISISMILVSFKLLYDSIYTLIYGSSLTFSWFLVIVCIITIITKFMLFLYTHRLAKKYHNILLEANQKDHRNDCIVTTFTLISVLLTLVGIYWFDGIVGIGISVWICLTGCKIFLESYNVLMDISIDDKTAELILDLAHHYKEIQKIDKIASTPVGYQYIVVLTIYVDGNMSTFESHNLADQLEKDACNLEKIYKAVVHVNPIAI
ncbi:MAG: cation transporter [Clostridia bacterium]|jgi:cation diffusion facilitator family transporter|nr:cation transporter [Clostridia bacterium]